MSIDYAALAKAGGIPKGKTVKQERAKRKRLDTLALQQFRMAVWARDGYGHKDGGGLRFIGCAYCYRTVYNQQDPFGEVHHIRSRRHKETRYDPKNGVILCHDCHELVTAKRITI